MSPIAERYSRALKSSRLQIASEKSGDVDVLIAAGWCRDGLGTMLYRTRTEFDALNRRELAQAADSLTARVLTLATMNSLPATRDALGRFAVSHATRQKFMQPDAVAVKIAWACLDLWLDPLCHACNGLGFTGGMGVPRQPCRACRETGLRKQHRGFRLHATRKGHEFGCSLLVEMDRKTDDVGVMMKRYLSAYAPKRIKAAEAKDALQKRLDALRSAAAQVD